MLHSVLHCVRQVKKLPVNHFVRAPQTSQQLDALSAGCSRGGSFKGGAILSLPGTKMAPLPSLPPTLLAHPTVESALHKDGGGTGDGGSA